MSLAPQAKHRHVELDLLRTAAIVAVFGIHCFGFWWQDGGITPGVMSGALAMHDLFQMAVPVLLFLSAYLMADRFEQHARQPLGRFYATRARSILVPTICWALIYWVFGAWANAEGIKGIWSNHIGLDWVALLTLQTSVHLWFMPPLIQIVLVFPALYRAVDRLVGRSILRAVALGSVVLAMKAALYFWLFRPENAHLAYLCLTLVFWFELPVLAILWRRHWPPGTHPNGGRTGAIAIMLLGATVVLSGLDAARLEDMGFPSFISHGNWRLGNELYALSLLLVFFFYGPALAKWLPARRVELARRFSERYAFAFYLGHILILTGLMVLERQFLTGELGRLLFYAAPGFALTVVGLQLAARFGPSKTLLGLR